MASHLINGVWKTGAPEFTSHDPSCGDVVWTGTEGTRELLNEALDAASHAQRAWGRSSVDERVHFIERFTSSVKENSGELAELISRETGKPLWEAKTEVAAVQGKLGPSLDAFKTRCATVAKDLGNGATSVTNFRPLGVVGVIGPFNFPAHMPNGHIIPALIAGNTVVLKPSELAPGVSEVIAHCWERAGLPPGVLNLIQGGPRVAEQLVNHSLTNAIAFTGSRSTGLKILRTTASEPSKLVALEMGGNSPLIIWDAVDVPAVVNLVVQSTYITSGQRCSAARRLIVSNAVASEVLIPLVEALRRLMVGAWNDEPEPFMGPVVSASAASRVLAQQEALLRDGGDPLIACEVLSRGPAYVSPGLIDMTAAAAHNDDEIFGPLLQVFRVDDFDEALHLANSTEFGLAAGLVASSQGLYDRFSSTVEAGILTWNQQLTGASGFAPFGGIKSSGNHRPSGYLAADYCSFPTGAVVREAPTLPGSLPPGLTL